MVLEGFIFQHSWKKVKGEGLRVGAWQLPFPAQVGKVKGEGLDVGACGVDFPAQVEKSQGWGPAFPLVDSGRVVLEGFIFQLSWKKKSRVKG